MKKVLMIAYSFPPTGGPGVQRSLKFAKYLRNFGWEPLVVTRDIKNMRVIDESLNKDIPEGVKIYRTRPCEFTELNGLLNYFGKFISRKVLFPDGERLWGEFAKSTAVKAIKKEKIDLIYTTSVPYSAHLMGLHLKRRFPGIPWVADFRDEWTNNPYLLDNPHNKFRMSIEKGMERRVLENADYLITNTPVMLDNFLRLNSDMALKDHFTVIPNGYDSDDFKAVTGSTPYNEFFTITYTGSMYGRRKPDYFFQALSELVGEGKIDVAKIKVQLIGTLQKENLDKLLNKYKLQEVVKILPYMDHDECVAHMAGSDALLLIEGGGPGSEAFYTGKVFEYLASRRPILANIPAKGAAAQLINSTHAGLVSDFNDIDKTKENLLKLYESWQNKTNILEPNKELIAKYERKVLTGELAVVFEKACKIVRSTQ